MMPRKIVIIGGVACGPKAAARARRRDSHADITILERGALLSYAGCGLPYYIGGAIPEYDGLRKTQYGVVRDEQFFDSVKGIKVRTRTAAEKIDRKKKIVHVKDLASDSTEEIPYDKLVLATGASPVRPPIKGLELERVFFVHHPADALRMRELIEGGEVDKAVLIGAGRISLEVSESLFAHAVDAVIVELEDSVLPAMLDPEIAATVANALRSEGVQVETGKKVLEIQTNADGQACGVLTESGEIAADMVVVATGVKPNVELAAAAGLEIGKTGAIAVNDCLQTSDSDIYAGGDCAECVNLVTGKKVYAPLGSTANRHGRIIGDNVTGETSKFPGIVGTSVMKTLGVNIAATGLTEREARDMGYSVLTSLVPWMDRAHYYPGGKPILTKLVADEKTGRILGGQVVGPGDVTKRIDTIAAALSGRATIEEAANLDVGYAPPYSTALDGIAHAANVLLNKRAGLAKSISAAEVRARIKRNEDFILLDVREANEVEKNSFDDRRVVAIPLSRLRTAKDEIPRDKELVCFCQLGMRSYEACRTLEGMGFDKVKYLEGGYRFWSESADTSCSAEA